jgi:UDP:flavonoid glycosyltransferase YjiC (YdhE family)
MDMAPATKPATPDTKMSCRDACAAATPTIKLAVETMPSFAPKTAARNQEMRLVRCCSAIGGEAGFAMKVSFAATGRSRGGIMENTRRSRFPSGSKRACLTRARRRGVRYNRRYGGNMNVLLVPLGSAGDVHPFLGWARTLQARGHRVSVLTNGYFRGLFEAAQLDFVEIGTVEEFHALSNNPDIWHPTRSLALLGRASAALAAPVLRAIQERARPGDTVVAAGSLAFGARMAREKLGVPTATVHLQPSLFRHVDDPPAFPNLAIPRWWPRVAVRALYRAVDAVADRALAPVNEARVREGLPAVRGLIGDWWHAADLTLGFFPDWYFTPAAGGPPVELVGFPLYDGEGLEASSPGVDEFFLDGPPPVVFAPGSAMRRGHRFFAEGVEACRTSGRRGVFLTRFPEQLPPALPPFIRHFPFVPFGRILRRAAALVHHGGIGTTAQAFLAGCPQVVVPNNHDQPDNARRVARLGAGVWMPGRRYHARSLAVALDHVTRDAGVKDACAAIQRRLRPGEAFERASDLLEHLLASSVATAPNRRDVRPRESYDGAGENERGRQA